MPITNLARTDVVTAPPTAVVADLAELMAEENVGSVVITEDDQPTGIVTDRDLALRSVGETADPDTQIAADVMSEGLETIPPEAGFYDVAELMADTGVRRVPVVENGELRGIITADDLTELLADEQQHLADVLRAQRPSY